MGYCGYTMGSEYGVLVFTSKMVKKSTSEVCHAFSNKMGLFSVCFFCSDTHLNYGSFKENVVDKLFLFQLFENGNSLKEPIFIHCVARRLLTDSGSEL